MKNLINQIERGKTEIESLIRRLKDSIGTNPRRETLSKSLELILTHVGSVSGQLNLWHNKREEQKQYYANKLSYEDIKKKEITKDDICKLFKKPGEIETLKPTTRRIPIHWCLNEDIKTNFWDRWWMVFDSPPCNNHEVPIYFLRKLYCEFVLKEVPNYFDFLESQGRGGGSSFDRPMAHRDPNAPRFPSGKPQVDHVSIPSNVKEHVEVDTLGTISALTQTLIQCVTPLVEGDHGQSVRGHFCHSCGSVCTFGTTKREEEDDGLMLNDFLNITFGIDTQVNICKFIKFI
jgi:hypothetical protein